MVGTLGEMCRYLNWEVWGISVGDELDFTILLRRRRDGTMLFQLALSFSVARKSSKRRLGVKVNE